jgi:hypothetical protein
MIVCFLLIMARSTFAKSFSDVAATSLTDFETIYERTGPGIQFTVVGESLIENHALKKVSEKKLSLSQSILSAILVWSGSVEAWRSSVETIQFHTADGKNQEVPAEKIWRNEKEGILYSAAADVTPLITQSGQYGVSRLASDAWGGEGYRVAGWALIVLSEDSTSWQVRTLIVRAGAGMARPGQIDDVVMWREPRDSALPSRVAVIGGHGRRGNGGGNLFNGRALSGREDWDGSAGTYWDIDVFDIREPETYAERSQTGGSDVIGIDPLLQWVYPVCFVVEYQERLKSKDSGGEK